MLFDESVEEWAEVGVVHDVGLIEFFRQALVGDDVVLVAVDSDFFGALGGADLGSSGFVAFGVEFGLFDFVDAGDQESPCFVAVLGLGFGFLHPDFHACGFVQELHGGGDFVDILAAWSLGGGDVFVDIVCPVDVDFDGFGFGEDGDGAGGGVDPALGFGGGDSLDGMDTRLE